MKEICKEFSIFVEDDGDGDIEIDYYVEAYEMTKGGDLVHLNWWIMNVKINGILIDHENDKRLLRIFEDEAIKHFKDWASPRDDFDF